MMQQYSQQTLCTDCIVSVVSRLWPSDVGITLEEVGPVICMLNGFVHVEGSQVTVYPYNPNEAYALGVQTVQKVARLGTYIGLHTQTYDVLRTYVLGELIRYDQVVDGSANAM